MPNSAGRGFASGSGGRRGSHGSGNSGGIAIDRRRFLIGAAGVGVAAVAGGGIFAATKCSSSAAEEAAKKLDPISVPENAVFTTENCQFLDSTDGVLNMVRQAELPYGSLVYANDDSVAACLLPCDTSNPLTKVGLLSLTTGDMKTVLENAVGSKEGFEIYDVRGNSSGAIWLESDILNDKWRIYTAKNKDGGLGVPTLVDEGNSEYEMPPIAVSGNYAFWVKTPNTNGSTPKINTVVMRIPFGANASDGKAVYETASQLACQITSSDDGVVIAPRAEGVKGYYNLVQIDAESGQVSKSMTLPQTLKPTFAAYGKSGFGFAFESIYQTGGGLSNLGTYTEGEGSNSSEWFRFPRTPFCPPAWASDLFFVKSTSVVAGIDLVNKRYFTIAPELVTQGYGEFLASTGTRKRLVTYSNIDYTPLNSDRVQKCNVRIWETA